MRLFVLKSLRIKVLWYAIKLSIIDYNVNNAQLGIDASPTGHSWLKSLEISQIHRAQLAIFAMLQWSRKVDMKSTNTHICYMANIVLCQSFPFTPFLLLFLLQAFTPVFVLLSQTNHFDKSLDSNLKVLPIGNLPSIWP